MKIDKSSYGIDLLGAAIFGLTLCFYGFCLTHKIDMTMADIGRHIRNGELFFQNLEIINTNFYSYTCSDFPAINHHWGSGVVFYLVWKVSGFIGLHLFLIGLSLFTFLLFFSIAKSHAGLALASTVSIFVIPLLAHRMDIRPEAFSYLFAGLFLWLLMKYRDDSLQWKRLIWILALLEVLWVNLHIYFILGPAIIGAFFLESLWVRREHFRKMLVLLIVISLVTLLNPNGLEGVLSPFKIFENYGYQLLENKPFWLANQVFQPTYFVIFPLLSLLLLASFVGAASRSVRDISFAYLILAVFVSVASWLAVRNFALFGFFVLPIIAGNCEIFGGARLEKVERKLRIALLPVLIVVVALAVTGRLNKFLPLREEFGVGLEHDNNDAAEFIKQHDLKGPIFNNFDVGGYLIFHLFPRERVFADNRPEAYPAEFFQQEYIPMQLYPEKWHEMLKKYDFQTVILAHKDSTIWSKQFKAALLRDPAWSLGFVNHNIVIFLRNK